MNFSPETVFTVIVELMLLIMIFSVNKEINKVRRGPNAEGNKGTVTFLLFLQLIALLAMIGIPMILLRAGGQMTIPPFIWFCIAVMVFLLVIQIALWIPPVKLLVQAIPETWKSGNRFGAIGLLLFVLLIVGILSFGIIGIIQLATL